MKIYPKSEGELLDQVASIRPNSLLYGAEQDDIRRSMDLLLMGQSPLMGHQITTFEEKFRQGPHWRFSEAVDKITAQHSRGKKPLHSILASAWNDEAYDDLKGGIDSGQPADYGYVGAVRSMRQTNTLLLKNNVVEAAKRPIFHPEWFQPDAHQLVLNGNPKRTTELFPNGNYLIHTTDIISVGRVLRNGELCSPIRSQHQRFTPVDANSNGGDFGISWSCNDIQVAPGTRSHLAGFMISPEDAQKAGTLFVPVDASAFELQFLGQHVGTEKYKELQAQRILWHKVFNEANKIAPCCREHFRETLPKSNLVNTVNAMNKGKVTVEDLREFYSFEKGITHFNPKLLESPISAVAVLLQSTIDGNDAAKVIGREVESVDQLQSQDIRSLMGTVLNEFVQDEYQTVIENLREVGVKTGLFTRIPVEDMVFCCSRRDLDTVWKHVFAHTEKPPKGVIVFDDKEIRVPDFKVHKGSGDHAKLASAIRNVIPASQKTLNWRDLLKDCPKQDQKGALRQFVPATTTLRAEIPLFAIDEAVANHH